MKQNFIILGPQGSGKTTQAELLAKKLKLEFISTGNLIREAINKKNKFSQDLLRYIKNGNLVPDEILFKKIFFPKIEKINIKHGIVFEGIPRNINQVKTLKGYFKENNYQFLWLIYIKISPKISYDRITKRKFCANCNLNYKPIDNDYKKNKCNKCKGKLIIREDDKNSKSLLNRLNIYNKQTKPVINYFRNNKKIIEINGEKKINEVHKEIISKIQKLND